MTEEATVAQRLRDLEAKMDSIMDQMVIHGIALSSNAAREMVADSLMAENLLAKMQNNLLSALFRDDIKIIRVIGKGGSGKTVTLRMMALAAAANYPTVFITMSEGMIRDPQIRNTTNLRIISPNRFCSSAIPFKYVIIDDLDGLTPLIATKLIERALRRIRLWETGKVIYSAEQPVINPFSLCNAHDLPTWQGTLA